MIFKLKTLDLWILSKLLKQDSIYSLEVSQGTGLGRSTVVTSLNRLCTLEFLKVSTEKGDRKELGRPLRTYYALRKPKVESVKKMLKDFVSVLDFEEVDV